MFKFVKKEKMNILMVLENSYPPDERVENEIIILTRKGFHVTLVCASKDRKGKINVEENENLTIYRLPVSKFIYKSSALALSLPFYFSFWYNHLNNIIKHSQIDAIHINDLPLVKVGVKLSKKHVIPVVADYHENRPEIMKMYNHVQTFPGKYLISIKRWLKYQQTITPQVDRLILVTDEAKDYYVNYYKIDAQKITVLPNYISLERFASFNPEYENNSEIKSHFTAVYFGDTGIRRGTLTILESASILRDEDILFLIIGNSREQKFLENEAKKQKLDNVIFTGRIPVADAIKLINISKVGLCPFLRNTHHDTTFANKMFQYMALGKPVIVSDCNSQLNFVSKESCGLIFKAGDASELSKQILRLRDQSEYDRLSKNARNCVYTKYNWENTGSRLTDLYSSLK